MRVWQAQPALSAVGPLKRNEAGVGSSIAGVDAGFAALRLNPAYIEIRSTAYVFVPNAVGVRVIDARTAGAARPVCCRSAVRRRLGQGREAGPNGSAAMPREPRWRP